MRVLDVERRLERVERLLRAAADEAKSARIDLGHENGANHRWAAMMFAVLDQLDREGGARLQPSRYGRLLPAARRTDAGSQDASHREGTGAPAITPRPVWDVRGPAVDV
jgi:hypothetical protein